MIRVPRVLHQRVGGVNNLVILKAVTAQHSQHTRSLALLKLPDRELTSCLGVQSTWVALGVKVLTRSLLILHTTQGLGERRSTKLTSQLARNLREQTERMESEKKRGGWGRLIPEGQLLSPYSGVRAGGHLTLTASALTNSGS